ncbi:MAG: hypothetical protein R8K48_00195 [Gallionella sp.]
MKNSIDARVDFSFRGENYGYKTQIDLDLLLQQYDAFPSLHVILARSHEIDTYSYLYEVMLEAEIEYSNPQGYAHNYLIEGKFNATTLATSWQHDKITVLLRTIVMQELNISDLNLHPALQRTLVATYHLGKKT